METGNLLNLFFLTLTILNALIWGWFALDFWKEQERRALKISLILLAAGSAFFYSAIYFTFVTKSVIFFTILFVAAISIILFLLPIGKLSPDTALPTRRVDERTIMFARHRLKPGTPEYEAYYRAHPEHEKPDARTRLRPGISSLNSKYPDPLSFAAAETGFRVTEALHPMAEGEPAPEQHPLTPEEATTYIKGLAKQYGAVEVGITELQPYQVYSHIGRGPGGHGTPIKLNHRYAIAFTVEMDYHILAAAPTGPVTIETAHQYVEAGKIAVQLAESIRYLGYPARAHLDANYRVVCPPLARDAGLGEVGRITLLISNKLGPRVRLAVVTTDLPLIVDPPTRDPAIIDFCNICQKCATNCPSRSIPFGERTMIDGVPRWKLNDETCFAYWNELGTDCAICMSVCPFSHPDTPLHNAVRWGISRSGFFRRVALHMDDLFYGKHPKKARRPDWLSDSNTN